MMDLRHGDCLELMKSIPDGSVDMVLTDPPYGTTACKWDSVIPFEPMWAELKRIIKPNGAIVLFGSEPFSSHLRLSNLKIYKYDLIYEKPSPSNPLLAKKRFMSFHENILVFYAKQPTYNAQKIKRLEKNKRANKNKFAKNINHLNVVITDMPTNSDTRHPSSILKFNRQTGLHPTQKPVALLEYLIKTYTNEGETILDFTMGSGSTGVACLTIGRKFIGIEKDDHYFTVAKNRIENHQNA